LPQAILVTVKSVRIGEIYNVGSGATVSVNRLVELLGGEKVHIPKRPGEQDSTFTDISKIKSELGWEPKVAIEDGVDEILKQIDYWKDTPVWTPDIIADATEDWFRYLS
jgi:UDP-glucose 4-epimerase